MDNSMRPGVFVDYAVRTKREQFFGKPIGLIAKSDNQLSTIEVTKINSLDILSNKYGLYSNMVGCFSSIKDNCDSDIYVVGISETDSTKLTDAYIKAFDLLFATAQPYCITSDYNPIEFLNHVKSKLTDSNGLGKIFVGNFEDIGNDYSKVTVINCERMVICAPIICRPMFEGNVCPAVMSAIISRSNSAVSNFVGEAVLGKHISSKMLTEKEKESNLKNGICAFEEVGGRFELIRGVTTKTLDASGTFDATYRDLSVIIGLDCVLKRLTNAVSIAILGGGASVDTISSVLICELIKLSNEKIISSYQPPKIALSSVDLSACTANIAVTLRKNINQIHLNLSFIV